MDASGMDTEYHWPLTMNHWPLRVRSVVRFRRRTEISGLLRFAGTRNVTRRSNADWQKWVGIALLCGSASWNRRSVRKRWSRLRSRWTIYGYRIIKLVLLLIHCKVKRICKCQWQQKTFHLSSDTNKCYGRVAIVHSNQKIFESVGQLRWTCVVLPAMPNPHTKVLKCGDCGIDRVHVM